ncbi:MFS transporter [Phyllobacterium lublinensis]|uniref:MFS transporter n=1 Tax=Phyllobacterium lublinensis TaxID=2875708 RepID=UPI001CCEC727|nr:MFS transporter [Phyllobacterium sp. 2063]MBZ9656243.1 MFS transporter [Phyllobacterium sp. 2063]
MKETLRCSSSARDPASLVVGAIAAQLIGGLVAQMSPLMIGGFMDGLSLSERDAGFVASLELLILAATAIAIAPFLPRISYRRISLAAVALTLGAQAASIFSLSLGSLALLRGLAGIGEGALYAVSLSIVASRSSNPDKVYGYFQIAWALGSVALFSVGGQVTEAFAHRGILALIAGVTLALAPFLFFIPDARANSGDRTVKSPALVAPPLLGVVTLSAIVLYISVSAALYAFSTPLGERAGLDTIAVGYALTLTTLIGLAGAAAATVLNLRWGRALPISCFCAAFMIVAIALCLWRHPTAYIVALTASGIIYYFSIPYLFGLAAALDRNGRWAAAAGSAYLLGFAIGPLAAGAVIAAGGYASLAAVCIAVTAVAWVLAMVVIRRLSEPAHAALQADAA